MRIDVLTTAVRRPVIIEKTFTSFEKFMLPAAKRWGADFRFFVNMDPVGEECTPQKALAPVYNTASHLGFNKVLAYQPQEANFPNAFIRCWNAVDAETDYVFLLEDDWEFIGNYDITHVIECLRKNPDYASMRLSAFPAQRDRMKNWNRFFPLHRSGEFFDCPKNLIRSCGFCGHPAIFQGNFVRAASPLLRPIWNPEKQFHFWNHPLMALVDKWRWGVFAAPGSDPAIRDIGKGWAARQGLKKAGIAAFFKNYEEDRRKQ